MPQPDLVLLLDLPVETAWERITSREKEAGVYETLDQLAQHRDKYRQICERYFGSRLRVIDASASTSDVAEAVWQAVESIIPVA
jgi:thymidylate kinase